MPDLSRFSRVRRVWYFPRQYSGRCAAPGLADQQVDVFRHSDVAYQREAIAIAHLVQIRDENIPGANRAQQRQASLTTECDEMEMPAPGVPKQFVGRRMEEKSKPQPFQSKVSAH